MLLVLIQAKPSSEEVDEFSSDNGATVPNIRCSKEVSDNRT